MIAQLGRREQGVVRRIHRIRQCHSVDYVELDGAAVHAVVGAFPFGALEPVYPRNGTDDWSEDGDFAFAACRAIRARPFAGTRPALVVDLK